MNEEVEGLSMQISEKASTSTSVKRLTTLNGFSAILYKEDTACNFLFAFRHTELLLKRRSTLNEKNCPMWGVKYFFQHSQNCLTEAVFILLKTSILAC